MDQGIPIQQIGLYQSITSQIHIWSKEEWETYIESTAFKYFEKQLLLKQLKQSFNKNYRSLIYPWIAQLYCDIPYELYIERKGFTSPSDQIIFRDIERTHSNLEYFKGRKTKRQDSNKSFIDDRLIENTFSFNQRRLFYILRAYSNIDSSIGYVQGMNYIAGSILYSLDYKDNVLSVEAKTLQVLLYINYQLNWRQTYSKSMKKIKSMVQYLQQQIDKQLPKLSKIIKQLELPLLVFVDMHFFTLMSYKIPFEFSIKVLDIFLIEGENIIFDILLRIFTLNEQEILQIKDKDEITQYIKDIVQISLEKFGIQALIPQEQEVLNKN